MKHLIPIIVVGILLISGFVTATKPKEIPIRENYPPDVPQIDGPRNVRPGTYEYKFRATDPESDNISYQIDWGDGTGKDWFGPFESGEEIIVNQTFYVTGRVMIRVRAKDTHGAIGDWGTFKVEISKDKHIINILFLQFLLSVLHFPLLQRLLGWLM